LCSKLGTYHGHDNGKRRYNANRYAAARGSEGNSTTRKPVSAVTP